MDRNIQSIIQEIIESIEDADLNFDTLEERQGNLRGLPRGILGRVTGSFKLAGQNSKIELYKANAKQRDLTQAQRAVGGAWERRWGDRYSRWKSSDVKDKEREVEQFKDAHQGVVVQINDAWAFFAEYSPYESGNKVYRLYNASGGNPKWNYNAVNTDFMSQNELSDYINFHEDKVDVYLVTTDPERIKIRDKRASNRGDYTDSLNTNRIEAVKKFVKSRYKDLEKASNEYLNIVASNIGSLIADMVKPETSDEEILNITKKIDREIENISDLIYNIRKIKGLSNGVIRGGNTSSRHIPHTGSMPYNIKRFQDYIKDMKKAMDI